MSYLTYFTLTCRIEDIVVRVCLLCSNNLNKVSELLQVWRQFFRARYVYRRLRPLWLLCRARRSIYTILNEFPDYHQRLLHQRLLYVGGKHTPD